MSKYIQKTKPMKNTKYTFAAIIILGLFTAGCVQNGKPDAEKKDTAQTAGKNSENAAKDNADKVKSAKTEFKTPGAVVMTMRFEYYEEGDYPHFLFKDLGAGNNYDFRFLEDNNLCGLPILLKDDKSAFGYKANPKYLNKVFLVETIKKDVMDADLQGNNKKAKEYVITGIKLK